MTNEEKSTSDVGECSMEAAKVSEVSLDQQTAKSNLDRRILSGSALAAAVAAVVLPLMKIKNVKAASDNPGVHSDIPGYLYDNPGTHSAACAADNFGGMDVGDIYDCADCLAALPADCIVSDTPGDHSYIPGDHYDTPGDHNYGE